jgi:hypothetical protein
MVDIDDANDDSDRLAVFDPELPVAAMVESLFIVDEAVGLVVEPA